MLQFLKESMRPKTLYLTSKWVKEKKKVVLKKKVKRGKTEKKEKEINTNISNHEKMWTICSC